MGKVVLGFVVVFAFSTVRGYTLDDLKNQLKEVNNYLERDLFPKPVISNLINLAPASSSVIQEAQSFLKIYLDVAAQDPFSRGFIDTEKLSIRKLQDEIEEAQNANESEISDLYQKIADLKLKIQRHYARWTSYMRPIHKIRNEEFKKCVGNLRY